uniref:non-specific serine/threonine protein kinase n=1 Tax=Sinocyclocheilus anshuiensis TaxID=1608454 RepID=A0A671LCN8_9TELE
MLEWFEEEDRFILILEYPQPCKDLLKFMVNNMQRVNESETRRLMYQAVLGAKHCLDRGVFHRDIKLNNFLINTKTNQVKLIDFGCGDLVKSSGYLGFTGEFDVLCYCCNQFKGDLSLPCSDAGDFCRKNVCLTWISLAFMNRRSLPT